MLSFYNSGSQVDTLIRTYNDKDSTIILNCFFVQLNIAQKKGDLSIRKKGCEVFFFCLDSRIRIKVCLFVISTSSLLSVFKVFALCISDESCFLKELS